MQDKKDENFDSKGNRTKIRALWNKSSDEICQKRNTPSIMRKLRDSPGMVFHQTVYSDIQDLLAEKHIKKVCVLGSGDNEAVFAFHFLGTEVTSVDISEKQIEHARAIADKLGMKIGFVVSDILDLQSMANDGFDMVYTSNGVLTWIDDLPRMFQETARILRRQGVYVMYDVHPFQRPWKDDVLALSKPYRDFGPIQDPRNEDARTFHWRMEDIVNSLTDAGLRIRLLRELDSGETKRTGYFWGDDTRPELNDWKVNPLAALPAWLELISERDA